MINFQIEYWKTEDGESTRKQHTIEFKDPPRCWRRQHRLLPNNQPKRQSYTNNKHNNARTTHKNRRNPNVIRSDLFNLWPYTNITAQVRVMNARYEGPASNRVHFMTREGGTYSTSYNHVYDDIQS